MNGLLHEIHVAEQAAARLFSQHAKSDITIRQAVVMEKLRAYPGCSQTDLVRHTGVDRSTLADVVRRLTKRGWAQRRRTRHDARAYEVKLTAEGHKVLTAATAAMTKAEKELVELMPAVRHLENGK